MKKTFLQLFSCAFFLLFNFCPRFSFAQKNTGVIKGIITTADNKPASGISIEIREFRRGSVSDDNGNYIIAKLPAGDFTLKVSAIGAPPQEKEITITAGEVSQENFTIDLTSQQLEDVIVNTKKEKYNVATSADVAKMPLKNIENPQVVSVVSNTLLKDQLNTDIVQALNNIPGAVAATTTFGGVSITTRGFTTNPSFRNGVPLMAPSDATARSSLDPVNIENIEALKGPSATLFGNYISSYGGVINIVTKKPFDIFKGEVGYSIGSWGLNRVTADINTPLNQDKTALFRVNAVVNKQSSYMETGHNNRYAFDPSLLLKVNDRLTLSFDMELYRDDVTHTSYDNLNALTNITNVNQLPVSYTQTFFSDNLNTITNTLRTYAEAKYKISDHWTSQTNISVITEHVNAYDGTSTFFNADSILRSIGFFDIHTTNLDIQHNLQGDFKIGSVRNRLVWGVDYLNNKSNMTYSFGDIDGINLSNPYTYASKFQADNAVATSGLYRWPTHWQQFATYISDLANITDNLLALASVRLDRYEQKENSAYKQTSYSPRFGLVYQPVKGVISLFGNYMSGFQNNAPGVQPDGTKVVFKPSYARQWESGIKIDGFNKRLTTSLSYYNIDVTNALRYDGNYVYQDGKQKSKGFEVDVTANPADGLNISGGYVYNDNKYIKADQSSIGKHAQYNPQNVANIWMSYRFQKNSVLNGFGLGLGGNYADKGYYDLENTITIPSYTIINASMFYDCPKWRIGIALNNIGNKKYWAEASTIAPQPTRNLTANVTYRF